MERGKDEQTGEEIILRHIPCSTKQVWACDLVAEGSQLLY